MDLWHGFTIDGPTSLDLDDALWIEESAQGWLLSVMISDVASVVHSDTSWDTEACKRVESRYFKDDTVPMLPRTLSEDSLSLLPDQCRPVIRIDIGLNTALQVVGQCIRRGQLRSVARLAYAEVETHLKGGDLQPQLKMLAQVAQGLLQQRLQNKAFAFLNMNAGIALDEEGQVVRLAPAKRNRGYLIVEAAMILANRVVAEVLIRQNAVALFRNHQARPAAPDREQWFEELAPVFADPSREKVAHAQERLALLMQRAEYGPQVLGHYGLNLPAYLHFTSPLRRYADLVCHRQITALVDNMPLPYTREQLQELGDHINAYHTDRHERANAHSKQLARQQAEQAVETQSEMQLAHLEPVQYYQVIQAALETSTASETVIASAQARLQADLLTLKEAFELLFCSPAQEEAWGALRRELLAYIAHKPMWAVSLLDMGISLCGWARTRYEYKSDAQKTYHCRALLTRDATRHSTPWASATTKKSAQQRAAVLLCYLFCQEALPDPQVIPSQAALPTELPSSSSWLDLTVAQKVARGGDYINAVVRVAQKNKLPPPRFDVTMPTDKPITFLCELTGEIQGETLYFAGEGSNKRKAKLRAARKMWEFLEKR